MDLGAVESNKDIPNMVNPIFKNIIYHNYLIDDNGNIWSKKHKKFLSPYSNPDGYLQVRLFENKKGTTVRIASLVAYTFIGQPPKNMKQPTVDHKDGNRQNNHISNLRWMEHKDNISIRLNKKNSGGRGEKNIKAELTKSQVKEICLLIELKTLSFTDIANKYNVGKTAISNIANRFTWTFISKDYPLRDKI